MACTEKCDCLLQLFREQSFALKEIELFLDTHPTNAEALACFKKVSSLLKETAAQYANACGPIISADADCEECWSWVKTPWPWERQA